LLTPHGRSPAAKNLLRRRPRVRRDPWRYTEVPPLSRAHQPHWRPRPSRDRRAAQAGRWRVGSAQRT